MRGVSGDLVSLLTLIVGTRVLECYRYSTSNLAVVVLVQCGGHSRHTHERYTSKLEFTPPISLYRVMTFYQSLLSMFNGAPNFCPGVNCDQGVA